MSPSVPKDKEHSTQESQAQTFWCPGLQSSQATLLESQIHDIGPYQFKFTVQFVKGRYESQTSTLVSIHEG